MRLANYLRPLATRDSAYNADPQIAAATARQIVTSQLFLTGHFAEVAANHPRASALAAEFSARKDLLKSVQPRLRYLEDVKRSKVDWHRRHQQAEITRAVHAWIRNAKPITFTSAQGLLDLTNATHEVTHNLGKSLRREILRADTNLGKAHPIHKGRIVRFGRRSSLDSALTDLVSVPAPQRRSANTRRPCSAPLFAAPWTSPPPKPWAPFPHPAVQRPKRAPTP